MIEGPALPEWMLGRSGYGIQNAKGPAEAATSPSHGSIIPEKDMKMNKAIDNTAPAEMKVSDKEVASAMRNLESAIRELMHMAELAAEDLDATFGPSSRISSPDDNSITYRVGRREDDRLSFLVNDVASRCYLLNKAFEAAWDGKETA